MADAPSPSAPLQKPVVADNSVLSNFVDAGLAPLLFKIVGGPVYISPSILDPMELPPYSGQPNAEFAKGLYKAQLRLSDARMAQRYPNRIDFVKQLGVLWQPALLDLATNLRRFEIERMSAQTSPQDAECLAFAELHGWVLLTEDNRLSSLAQSLGVHILRTCGLLELAAKNGLIGCSTAADSFNRVMVETMGFYVLRNRRTERLYFRCSPPRCEWDKA